VEKSLGPLGRAEPASPLPPAPIATTRAGKGDRRRGKPAKEPPWATTSPR